MFRKSNYDDAQQKITTTQRKIDTTAQAISEYEKQTLQSGMVSKGESGSGLEHLNHTLVEQKKILIQLQEKLIKRIEQLMQRLKDELNTIEIALASIQITHVSQQMDDEKEHEYEDEPEANKLDELTEKKVGIEKHLFALTDLLIETKKAKNTFPIEYLPEEIILYILAKLEPVFLIKLATVNKAWLAWALDESLWHEKLKSMFGKNYIKHSERQGSYYSIYKIATINGLMEKYGHSSQYVSLWELILTVFNGDTEKLKALLDKNLEILEAEYQEKYKNKGDLKSLLFYIAIEYGRHDILILLVTLGVNVYTCPTLLSNVNSDKVNNWFPVAAFLGNVSSLKYLYDHFFSAYAHTDMDKDVLIEAAIDSKNTDVFTFIMNKYWYNGMEEVTKTNYLHRAARSGNWDIFKSWYTLIQFNFFDYFKPDNIVVTENLFHSAITGNNSAIMRFLVGELGAWAVQNTWTGTTKSALINAWYALAIEWGKPAITQYLVAELGATLEPSLLISAIEDQNVAFVKKIVSQAGCDINAVSFEGATPLRVARFMLDHQLNSCDTAMAEIVDYLTQCGAKDNTHAQLIDELKARLEVLLASNENSKKAVYLGKLMNYIIIHPTLPLHGIIEKLLDNNASIPDLESLDGILLQLNSGVEKSTSYSLAIFSAKKTRYSQEIEIIMKHLKVNEWHPDSLAVSQRLKAVLNATRIQNDKSIQSNKIKKHK